jgi:glycosyltransferase involved in cell wall biosynthesis
MSPATDSGVWALIPALNEEASLPTVLQAVRAAGMKSLVVDDGSTDRTGELASAQADLCVRHGVRQGRGYALALASGMKALAERGDVAWVVTLDADGQLSAADASALVAGARAAGATVAIGVRSSKPTLSERTAAVLYAMTFGIRDPFCGMKAFSIEVLRRHLGWAGRYVNLALPVRAVAAGAPLYQMPIALSLRLSGRSAFRSLRSQLRLFGAALAALTMGFRGDRPR